MCALCTCVLCTCARVIVLQRRRILSFRSPACEESSGFYVTHVTWNTPVVCIRMISLSYKISSIWERVYVQGVSKYYSYPKYFRKQRKMFINNQRDKDEKMFTFTEDVRSEMKLHWCQSHLCLCDTFFWYIFLFYTKYQISKKEFIHRMKQMLLPSWIFSKKMLSTTRDKDEKSLYLRIMSEVMKLHWCQSYSCLCGKFFWYILLLFSFFEDIQNPG